MSKPTIDPKYKYLLIKIGLNVLYYRKLKNITQEELAEKINMSRTTIANIENADKFHGIALNTIFRLSDALEVSVKQLFDFREENE